MKILLLMLMLFSFSVAEGIDSLLQEYEKNSELSNKTKDESAGNLIVYTRDDLERMQAESLQDVLKSLRLFSYIENRIGQTDILNQDEMKRFMQVMYDLVTPDGTKVVRSVNREDAADNFNQGKVRFLISTEAGGEGIDLQERCYSLIHVDLPWNPMRLHQRVGRLNRYGQKHRVYVTNFRNPHTVEARICD